MRGRGPHARPWLGDNAIHAAIEALAPIADLPIRDVEIGGLIFREVVSVTTIAGGIAGNVVPDHVEATVNFRYAPNRSPAEAEARLRELLGHPRAEVAVVGNGPPGPVCLDNPLLTRLRAAGRLEVRPKQAWTPVAEFAAGVDAVNPGREIAVLTDDEQVSATARACARDRRRSWPARSRRRTVPAIARWSPIRSRSSTGKEGGGRCRRVVISAWATPGGDPGARAMRSKAISPSRRTGARVCGAAACDRRLGGPSRWRRDRADLPPTLGRRSSLAQAVLDPAAGRPRADDRARLPDPRAGRGTPAVRSTVCA